MLPENGNFWLAPSVPQIAVKYASKSDFKSPGLLCIQSKPQKFQDMVAIKLIYPTRKNIADH